MAISLKDIQKGVKSMPPRLCVYGVQGIGKSTFAAGAPNPIFIQTEDGLDNIDTTSFPLASSYQDVMDQIGVLYTEEHDFQTLNVDSLDWLEPLIWQAVCKEHDKESIEDFGYGKGYTLALPLWRDFFEGINALRRDRGMAVILLAHEHIKRFDAPDTDPYDRYEIKLHKGAAALVQEWADAILFANYKVFVTQKDAGFNKKTNRGVGTGERQLHTQEMPAYRAKNRYNLPPTLPLIWTALHESITNPQDNQPAAKAVNQ